MIRSIDWPAEAAEQALPVRDTAVSAPGSQTGDALLLLQALRQRLAFAAGDAFSADCMARGDDPATRIRATVLECVADLGHLRQMMADEVDRVQVLEHRIAALQAAPAAAWAELAGRRAQSEGPTLRPITELFRTRLDRAPPEALPAAPARALP